jgi:hypothetical protein
MKGDKVALALAYLEISRPNLVVMGALATLGCTLFEGVPIKESLLVQLSTLLLIASGKIRSLQFPIRTNTKTSYWLHYISPSSLIHSLHYISFNYIDITTITSQIARYAMPANYCLSYFIIVAKFYLNFNRKRHKRLL